MIEIQKLPKLKKGRNSTMIEIQKLPKFSHLLHFCIFGLNSYWSSEYVKFEQRSDNFDI